MTKHLEIRNAGPVRELTLDLSPGLNVLRGANGCLAGGTLIDVPRNLTAHPHGVPIRDLVGSAPLVYAYNVDDQDFTLTKARSVWCTGRRPVYRALFKAQRGMFTPPLEITGTGDHLVLTVGGEYRPLAELRPGDHVMALRRRSRDSLYAALAFRSGLVLEHRFISGVLTGSPLSDDEDAHHEDLCGFNNTPDNIKRLSHSDHMALHARTHPPHYGVHPRGMLGKRHTEDSIKKITAASRGMSQASRKKQGQSLREFNARQNRPWMNRERLVSMYAEQGLTTVQIGAELGTSSTVICSWLERFGVPRRTNSEAQLLRRPNHEVIGIEFVGEMDVYDIEVPETHNFIANGIVAHNSGKSHSLNALARALGVDIPVALRDGARELSVTLDGDVILSLTKVRDSGDIEGALLSSSPIAEFIIPGVKDADKAEERRIAALLRMVDLPVTPEAIATLVGDPAAVDYVTEQEPDLPKLNIVEAKDKIRLRLHKMKRHFDEQAAEAQGEINSRRLSKPERFVETTPEDARYAYDQAKIRSARLEGECEQRIQREEERKEIAASLGERPDEDEFRAKAIAEADNYNVVRTQIESLERQLSSLKYDLERHSHEHQSFLMYEAKRAKEVEDWDSRKAILETPITGATPTEVQEAHAAAESAYAELQAAQESETYRQSLQVVEQASTRRESARQAAIKYEKLATTATARLGQLLASAGVEGLTVDEDRLCTVGPDGKLEAFHRLSFGQRVRIACGLLAKQKAPRSIIALPWQFHASLSPENIAEASAIFAEHGLYVLTESPASGELRVEQAAQAEAPKKARARK